MIKLFNSMVALIEKEWSIYATNFIVASLFHYLWLICLKFFGFVTGIDNTRFMFVETYINSMVVGVFVVSVVAVIHAHREINERKVGE